MTANSSSLTYPGNQPEAQLFPLKIKKRKKKCLGWAHGGNSWALTESGEFQYNIRAVRGDSMRGQLSVALLKISMTTRAFSAQQAESCHCRGFRKHGCARGQTPHLPSRPPECLVHISGEITVMFKAICSQGNSACTLEHRTAESTLYFRLWVWALPVCVLGQVTAPIRILVCLLVK